MPSLTHIPACTTKGCPAPKDPDWHIPWCGHGTEGHHHHVPKRSQGGKRIVAFLCPACHDRVDNTSDWDNSVSPGEDGLEYILWDTRVEGGWNSPLICRRIDGEAGSAAAEKVITTVPAVPGGGGPDSAVAPSASPLSPAGEEQMSSSEQMVAARPNPSPAPPSLALPGTITPTSLTLPQALSYERWEQAGETLGKIHRASRFWIGDWLVFGEDTFGEKVGQAMDVTGLQFETLANIASVCRRVPASRRRECLGFSHHAEVAAQEPDRQGTLLGEAEKRGWSVRALREATSGPSEPKERHECPTCGQDHVVRRV